MLRERDCVLSAFDLSDARRKAVDTGRGWAQTGEHAGA